MAGVPAHPGVSAHSEGLSRPCLAVCKDGAVVAVDHALHHLSRALLKDDVLPHILHRKGAVTILTVVVTRTLAQSICESPGGGKF